MIFDCFSLQYLSELKFGGKHCCFECQNSILLISEIEVLSKPFIDILCVDKKNLMQVSLTISLNYQGINSHQLEEIVVLREGRNSFCSRRFYCKTNEKLWSRKCWNYMSRTSYWQKEVVHPFCLPTPRHK